MDAPENFGKVVFQDGDQVQAVTGYIRREDGFFVIRTTEGKEFWVAMPHVFTLKFTEQGVWD